MREDMHVHSGASARRALVAKKHIIILGGKMTDHFARPLFLSWDCVEPFEAALKLQYGPSTYWLPPKSTIYMEKNPGMFSSKYLISLRPKKDMNILDDMGVSKLSGL